MGFLGGILVVLMVYAGDAQARDFLNLTLAGYQGWFGTPKDGVHNRWNHWGLPGRVTFELYPDVSEYDPTDLYPTPLGPLNSGSPSQLFSSVREGVIDTHFRWMSEYGIDGVALQRFANELSSEPQHFRNVVSKRVVAAAEKWDRYFYLTYDLSGANPRTLVEDIKRDWTTVFEDFLPITQSPNYVRQNGKPVIGLWGLGFEDRPVNPQQALELIEFFRNRGFYVLGGTPWWWRQITNWQSVYFQLDVLQPWGVGSYRNSADLNHMHLNVHQGDLALLRSKGIAYQRVIFPGFAWSNWNGGEKNMIPRLGGRFMWEQALKVKQLSVSTMIAMFDEYDEATAIAKAAESKASTPKGHYFLTLDEDGEKMSSDFYLRLSGAITKMLRGEISPQARVPVPLKD